jgi:hypothetical protein
MNHPIALFYHCCFYLGEPPTLKPGSMAIVKGQMDALRSSGLLEAAASFTVGINGSRESVSCVKQCLPSGTQLHWHGVESKSENLTIREIEKWAPGHPDWNTLYFHSKGVSNGGLDDFSNRWRSCMMRHLVLNWRNCVVDLNSGIEAVGCHWMRGLDDTQHYFAGNFWWAKSSFLNTLPSINERAAIKTHGLAAAESRYEAEVWLGNGPRLPRVKDYHPGFHHRNCQ